MDTEDDNYSAAREKCDSIRDSVGERRNFGQRNPGLGSFLRQFELKYDASLAVDNVEHMSELLFSDPPACLCYLAPYGGSQATKQVAGALKYLQA